MAHTHPFPDFGAAASGVLGFLQARLGFDLCMVTRVDGDDWIVIELADRGYDVKQGAVHRWSDTLCSRMVLGQGPHVAPRAASIPAYAEAPLGRQLRIGAYLGVPLTRADGSLYGTLCAIHPFPLPENIESELPLV